MSILWYRLNGALKRAIVGTVGSGGSTPPPTGTPLTWAPPAGWESYTPYTLPVNGGYITLNNSTNYRLLNPSTNGGVITRTPRIAGGRNIVWMGGQVQINTQDISSTMEQWNAAVAFGDGGGETSGRIIHVEGLRATGKYLTDGMHLYAPTATMQLQNAYIAIGAFARDSAWGNAISGTNGPHPDGIQCWGGCLEGRLDNVTILMTYQGLLVERNQAPNYPRYRFRRVNIRKNMDTTTDAWIESNTQSELDRFPATGIQMGGWSSNAPNTGQIFIDNGTVWCSHPNKTPEQKNGWVRPTSYNVATDGTGKYGEYPASVLTPSGAGSRQAYVNWAGTGNGRIYDGNPPAGDYVNPSNVGIGYVSPGYV